MDGIPATLADSAASDYIPELLVVGSYSFRYNLRAMSSNKDNEKGLPHVYAGGSEVQCPDIFSQDGWVTKSGTSHGKRLCQFLHTPHIAIATSTYILTREATAATAGLAAYFMALGNEGYLERDFTTPQLLKDYITKLAYPRGDWKEAKFIYNGIRPSDVGRETKGPVS